MSRIIVIGGGIIGCSVAYELARRNISVEVVESRKVAQGATQASAGVLAPQIEGHQSDSLRVIGELSLQMYDDFVARPSRESGIDVEYRRIGTIELTTADQPGERWAACRPGQAQATSGTSLLGKRALRSLESALAAQYSAGLFNPAHGYVAAEQLTQSLAEAGRRRDVIFSEHETVSGLRSVANGIEVLTSRRRVLSNTVVLTAGSWSGKVALDLSAALPVRPIRGQLVRLRHRVGLIHHILWADRCYLVPWMDGTILVGATVEDVGFDERATAEGIQGLLDAAIELIPELASAEFQGIRVGLRPAAPDDLPIIGRLPTLNNVIVATAHYRNGILLAPLTASLVADMVTEVTVDASVADPLSPARFGPGNDHGTLEER